MDGGAFSSLVRELGAMVCREERMWRSKLLSGEIEIS